MTTLKTAVPGVTITETGLLVPDIADVLSGRLTDLDAAMGGGASQPLSSPQGQISQSDTEIIATNYDALLCLFNQINPDYATGRFQDGFGSIYFMERIAAQGTIVTATCTGGVGRHIPAGSTAMDESGYIYQSINGASIGSSGHVDIQFQNQTTGPIPCGVGELNQIYSTGLSGWDAVRNDAAGVVGVDVESRVAFETRRKQSVSRNGRNTDAAMLAALLSTDGVLDAYVWSNRTDATVNSGATNFPVLRHSVYACVYGGVDADVAEAIFTTKNPGANLNGNATFTVEDKENYNAPYPQYIIQWQKATPLRIYFKVEIETNENLPSDISSQIKSMVETVFNGGYDGITKARIGGRINSGTYYAPIISISPDYVNISSISISGNGVDFSQSLTAGIDQIPTIQQADIEVTLM